VGNCFYRLTFEEGNVERGIEKGTWDSIHVVEVIEGEQTTYKLTSTIILSLKMSSLELSGSIQKTVGNCHTC
jgi:hypothetical protein